MNELMDKSILDTGDPHVTYLLKRWHKVSMAIFIVTNSIKDNDQIKWNIRNRSLDIMSFMYEISDTRNGHKHTLVDSCLKEIEILISELTLAVHTGLVGKMNYGIIFEEVEKFIKEISDFRDKDAVLSPLQKEFMHIDEPSIPKPSGEILLKDKAVSFNKSKGQSKGQIVSDATGDKARQERRKAILEVLKNKSNLGIKDFVAAIKGYSQKTIQRELTAMVEEGVLYKTGDRRWSTYSLVL